MQTQSPYLFNRQLLRADRESDQILRKQWGVESLIQTAPRKLRKYWGSPPSEITSFIDLFVGIVSHPEGMAVIVRFSAVKPDVL